MSYSIMVNIRTALKQAKDRLGDDRLAVGVESGKFFIQRATPLGNGQYDIVPLADPVGYPEILDALHTLEA